MAWVKLEDAVVEHRKHLKAGPAACWLWVCGIAYCQRQLSDGFIPEEAIPMIGVVKGAAALAAKLVEVGLFEQVEGGYQVHDYLDHNMTKAAALGRREEQHAAKVKAGQAGSRARWQKDSSVITDRASTPMAPSHPIPSHPIPKEQQSGSKRPIFTGQRFTVFEWQLDRFARLLGPHIDTFDLHAFFFDLDAAAVASAQVIPQRDSGAWLEAQVLQEAKRRHLPMAAASDMPVVGKQTSRLMAAVANIKAQEAGS